MKKRFISLTLALVTLFTCFNMTACGRQELAEKSGIVAVTDSHNHAEEQQSNPLKAEAADVKSDELANVEAEAEALRAELAEAEASNSELQISNDELAKALEEAEAAAEAKVAEAQAEVTKLQAENDTLLKKIQGWDEMVEANAKLQKAYDELVTLHESGYFVLDGTAYCKYEYAVKRTLNQLSDGTWYHQANANVTDVVLYDDIIIGGSTMVYIDKTVEMARKDWNIAVSFDGGKSIYSASIGNYNWANDGAFQGNVLKTGYAKVETDKNGKFGRQDTIAQVIIGVVANANAELGVDFYVKAGLYQANPEVCSVCYKQNCEGHCNICWHVLSQCICEVKTEYVEVPVYVDRCMICGKTDCQGHVETKVETETEYVDRCMICGKTDCDGHVETKFETETIKVCMICGKTDCDGHVETETVKVCMICGETDCDGHVETETVYVCNKCKNPIEDCTCDDSDHNDLEDIPNPNEPVEPGHNDLEDVEDPNKQPSSGSDHSNLGSSSNSGSDENKNSGHNSTSSGSTKKSSHSALD